MKRCHLCGTELPDIPSGCLRCENIFCPAHFLPKAHHGSGHINQYCDNCGRVLTELSYSCNRCGAVLCPGCRLPENHHCSNSANRRDHKIIGIDIRRKILKNCTLKNITLFSFSLMLFGFFLQFFSPYPQNVLFQLIFNVGFGVLLLSYFMYAVDHWEINNKILAMLMVVTPLIIAYILMVKIPPATNVLVYGGSVPVVLVIVSVVLLYIGEIIKTDFNNYFLKTDNRNDSSPLPKISYAIFGMVIVSVLIIGITISPVLSENMSTAPQFFNTSTNDSQNTQTSPIIYDPTVIHETNTTTIRPVVPVPVTADSLNYETGATSRILKYVLRGESGSIKLSMYSGVQDKILSQPTPVACMRYDYDKSPCNKLELEQYYLKYLDDPIQKKELEPLVQMIQSKTANPDDQARIAISLVQNIPYDKRGLFSANSKMITPYAVLYENKGVCSEKSLLLAYLLRELGYGVVLFSFNPEHHMSVGIKSPIQYSYINSGYAFIESTAPSIPTNSEADYVGVGKLISTPELYHISDGSSFSSISEEYQDSIALNQLGNEGGTSPPEIHRQWETLARKYGIISSDGRTILELIRTYADQLF